jgi:hypothetical protein
MEGLSLDDIGCSKVAEVGERGGAVGSCHGLQKLGGKIEGRECRELSRAARKWQGCMGFYGVE